MNFLILLLGLVMYRPVEDQSVLKLEITNVHHQGGKLWIAIVKPTGKLVFKKPDYYEILPVTSTGNYVTTFKIPPGRYAAAVYHDINGNDQMDKNLLGIPKEPYGFSNDFRPMFASPDFEDCAFDLPSSGKKITIRLSK